MGVATRGLGAAATMVGGVLHGTSAIGLLETATVGVRGRSAEEGADPMCSRVDRRVVAGRVVSLAAVMVVAVGVMPASAQVVFSDDFELGASPTWRNDVGAWEASGGSYSAAAPSNFPNARSSLPFVLSDCALEAKVIDVSDGGIWVRSQPAPGTPIGAKGVLLVTKGTGLYWHVVADGTSYGAALAPVSGLFTPGVSDPVIRVVVTGNLFEAFVDGAKTPATSIETDLFPIGCTALYDFSVQRFDDVVLEGVSLCPSDLSCDLEVGAADLAILLGGWGQPGFTDLDDNGTTDAADLALLLGAWGPCAG